VPMCANVTGQQQTLVTLKMVNVFAKRDILEIIVQKHVKMANGAPVANISANVEVTIVTKKMASVNVHRAIWVQIAKLLAVGTITALIANSCANAKTVECVIQ